MLKTTSKVFRVEVSMRRQPLGGSLPSSSEQSACFIPIRIDIGHCLAGYVAWSKETVRISNIAMVTKLIRSPVSLSFLLD